ncbi:MAG: YkgJ family cysteine cluster protein [Dehalococcoidia bacterium]|nr:MAG: YkgJ family cysteine cluster protein [Dehalococcoidia bacterium]
MSASTDLALIKEVQRKARHGESGEWRKEYTRQYRQVLEHIFGEIQEEIRPYSDSPEEGITCRKGCTHCCEHFVSVSVSHALLITDYLYASGKAMSAFLRGYGKWLRTIEDNPQAAAVFSSLEEHTASAAVVKPYSQELLSAYHACTIPCPFLDAGQCSIYPVRPVCCAAYFSVSHHDYCRADSDTLATIFEVAPSQANLRRMAELTDPRLFLHQENLPKLVYKLLRASLPEVVLEVERLFNSDSPGK